MEKQIYSKDKKTLVKIKTFLDKGFGYQAIYTVYEKTNTHISVLKNDYRRLWTNPVHVARWRKYEKDALNDAIIEVNNLIQYGS